MDIGGYYDPIDDLAERAMRPSSLLNGIINEIS
jgi:monomeric isocitrate dehydrogenase